MQDSNSATSDPEGIQKTNNEQSLPQLQWSSTTPSTVPFAILEYDWHDKCFYFLYFIGRYFAILMCYFLCIIGSLYSIGSIITLEATDFLCPIYTEEEVRQHSFNNGLPEGDRADSCWYINERQINFGAIKNLDIKIFTANIYWSQIGFIKWIQSLLYAFLTLFLLIYTLKHTYLLLYDTYFAILSIITKQDKNYRIYN